MDRRDRAAPGKHDLADLRAIRGPERDPRGRSGEREDGDPVARHREALDDVVALRDDRAPRLRPRVRGVHAHDPVVRRADVRAQPQRVVERDSARDPVAALLHHPAFAGPPVEEVQVVAAPADPRTEEDPAAVGRGRDVGDVLLCPALPEDERVALVRVAEDVGPHAPVVLLVTRRDGAFRGMARVVEAAVDPRHRGALRIRDALREIAVARDVAHAERRHLVAAARQTVRDVAPVVRGVPPVERHEPVAIERVRIDDGAVRAAGAVADVEHVLLLVAAAAGVKELPRHRPRRLEQPDGHELAQPPGEVRALRQRVEDRARPGVLRVRPLADLGRGVLLEPAVGIGDALAVDQLDDVLAPGQRRPRRGHRSRLEFRATQTDQGSS